MAELGLHYLYNTGHLQHEYSEAYYDAGTPQGSLLAMSTYHQPEQSQRKRPKYTRSKTGCMTCRQKKVKCDEEKPDCARCRASGRHCVWPEGATRKRNTRRDTRASHSHSPSLELRPHTTNSSSPSGASTSPHLHSTTPKVEPEDPSLPQTESHPVYSASQYSQPDHLQSHRTPDVQESTKLDSTSSITPIIHTSQYHAHPYDPNSYSRYAPPASYGHIQAAQPQYPEARLIKLENDDSVAWQASISQHVDPIHPFTYPTVQAYYTTSHDITLPGAAQSPHGQFVYPYMKYH